MCFHIRWTSKRKFATLRMTMLALFHYRLMTFFDQIKIRTSSWPIHNFHGFSSQQVLCIRSVRHACTMEPCYCSGWLSTCGTAWVPRTSSKFRQAVLFALDFDQWQFAITEKVPQHYDGSIAVGMSSLDKGRMEILKGTFFNPLRIAL